jgi:hypothetical protein
MSIKKDIDACLLVLKSCTEERQSAFDYKLISTLERCLKMESALAVYADKNHWHENYRNCDNSVFVPKGEKYHSNIDDFNGWEIAQKALRSES